MNGEPAHRIQAPSVAERAVRPEVVRAAAAIAAEAVAHPEQAQRIIGERLRAERKLWSADRRLVGDAAFGILRRLRTIDALLAKATAGPAAAGLGVGHYAAYLALERIVPAAEAARVAAEGGVTLALDVLAEPERVWTGIADPLERAAVELSWPTWLLGRLAVDFGPQEGLALARALNERAPLVLRVNRARAERPAILAELAKSGIDARPAALAADGIVLGSHVNVFELAAYRDGRVEVQDEGSQLVAEIAAPGLAARALVVDACAGAGGKTLALAAGLARSVPSGRVVGLDVSKPRLAEARKRAKRARTTNVEFKNAAGGVPAAPSLLGKANLVLVDAPCSGVGAFRRHPEGKWCLWEETIGELAARQLEILQTYAPLVAPGGRLVYATCSVLHEENEGVVSRFVAAHTEFAVVSLKEVAGAERAARIGDGTFLRVLPHRHGTDGFFGAVLVRT